MTRQNRVTPVGEIVADPSRGALMGNRGCLHDAAGRLGRARWRTQAWIACRLSFRGRHREVMAPGRYTELFFLDEATAYAAGHRPCAECRRADFTRFMEVWRECFGPTDRVGIVDRALHAARVDRQRRKITFFAPAATLPGGTMIRSADGPALIRDGALRHWSNGGYGNRTALPRGAVEVLTPEPVVAQLRSGLPVAFHPDP